MVEVVLENVTKRFGRVVAVDNVSLVFEDGSFTALLGPSGSGKTTILYLVAGIYKPSSGRILFGDRDVTKLPPNERNVGLVFQNYALYPHMTVYDNIAFPLRIRKYSEEAIEKKVREVASMLRIEGLLDRYPAQLSGGQQQRVALARALVREPSVLLLDEPLSNLDALLRIMIRTEIKRLQKEIGITAIYVTHDHSEALAIADKIVVINQGRLQQVGGPDEVYNKPRNLFVASFIGSPPANVVPARVSGEAGGEPCLYVAKTKACGGGGAFYKRLYKAVILGLEEVVMVFRPEHGRLSEEPKPGYVSIPGEVYAVEPLGREDVVTLVVGATTVKILESPENRPRTGAHMFINIDPDKILLFDPRTELNIDFIEERAE